MTSESSEGSAVAKSALGGEQSPAIIEKFEEIDETACKAELRVPQAIFKTEYEATLEQVIPTVKLKGFRPGKAPRKMVEQLHGKRIRFEVGERLVSGALQDVVKEKSLNVVGQPDIDLGELDIEQDIAFSVVFHLFPKPEITGYESFDVEVEKREVSDQDVNEVVDRILGMKSTRKPVTDRDTLQEGDIVDGLLQVTMQGEEPSPEEPLVVGLGEGQLPEDLEKGMLGMKVGETKVLEIALGNEHPNEELRGKQASYRVVLNGIAEKVLPDLTDDFVKTLGYENVETAIELKVDIRKRLEEEAQGESQQRVREAILTQLLERNDFKVPEVLIDDEIRNMLGRSGMVDPEKIDVRQVAVNDELRKMWGEEATKRVKMTVLIDRVTEVLKVQANDEDMDAYTQDISEKHSLPVEEVKKYFLDKSRALSTWMEVSRDKTLAELESRAKVKFVEPKEPKDSEEKPAA